MAHSFKQVHLRIDEETYNQIKTLSDKTGESISETTRNLLKKGLANEWVDENTDLIAQTVRQQMEIVMKPHVERLAALSSKTGHMASTATFLNVQAFMDLVTTEKKKDVRSLYDKARKKAVEYMRTKAEDWNEREEL